MLSINPKVIEQFALTAYQVDNLITLANFLESDKIPPPVFSIATFTNSGNEPSEMTVEAYNECGTTACAVGHGPLAGIAPLPYENWGTYSARAFISSAISGWRAFDFMFGSGWGLFPNRYSDQDTALATAKRIKYFLTKGLPEGVSYFGWSTSSALWMGLDEPLESA